MRLEAMSGHVSDQNDEAEKCASATCISACHAFAEANKSQVCTFCFALLLL